MGYGLQVDLSPPKMTSVCSSMGFGLQVALFPPTIVVEYYELDEVVVVSYSWRLK